MRRISSFILIFFMLLCLNIKNVFAEIRLNKNEISIGTSENFTLTITGNTTNNIKWDSSDTSIANVVNGTVYAKKSGTTYISVTDGVSSDICKVTVINSATSTVKLLSISLPQTYKVTEGGSGKLTVTYNPGNATNKNITWRSSNPSIVSVDTNGNLKGLKTGTATITATSSDGNHVATSKITVESNNNSLKGIALDKNELTLKMGESSNLKVTFNPENAANKKVTWRSIDPSVVTVDNGTIKAVGAGKASVVVTSEEGNYEASCQITVPSPPIELIAFTNSLWEVPLGTTLKLTTMSTPTGSIITDPIWTSSNDSIVSVDNTGTITAHAIGKVTIEVSDKEGKIKASTVVNVTNANIEKLIINIEGYDINFDESKTNYIVHIKNEDSLNITTNRNKSKVVIAGNRDLQDGSIITVTVNENNEKKTYVFNITKGNQNVIYFIVIIALLILINILRIRASQKKKLY